MVLLCAYAVATWLAPAGRSLAWPQPEAGLLGRLFPGVPALWVLGRIASLAAGAVLLVMSGPVGSPLRTVRRATRTAPSLAAGPWSAWLATASSLALLIWLATRPPTGPVAASLYVLGAVVPALTLGALALAPRRRACGEHLASPPALACLGVVLVWLVFAALPSIGSPLAASMVDLWESHRWLERALQGEQELFGTRGQPGISQIYMVLLGVPGLPASGPELLAAVQSMHFFWLAVTGLALGGLVAVWVRAELAPVGVAAFLFSPFALSLCTSPSPFGMMTALGTLLLLLLGAFVATASEASLLALASIAGLCVMSAYLYPLLAFGGLVTAGRLARGPRPRPVALLAATLAFAAAAAPSLPGPDEIGEMSALYVDRNGAWLLLESILLGQRDPFDPPGPQGYWNSGAGGPLDVALGALLAPFATPRTAIRLWSDSLLEPVATALATVGLLAALRHAARSSGSRALLLVLGFCLLPGTLASAYDRASLLRNLFVPSILCVAAAGALSILPARAWEGRPGRAAALAAGLGLLGWLYFSASGLARLPESAVAIAIRAVGDTPPPGGAVWLDHRAEYGLDWLFVAPQLEQVGRGAIRRVPLEEFDATGGLGGRPRAELLLWSPGLEDNAHVAGTICRLWPGASLFVLLDRAGLNRAFAARPDGPGWRPQLDPRRFVEISCDTFRRLRDDATPGRQQPERAPGP